MPSVDSMESVILTLWRASWQASVLVLLVLLVQGLMRHRLSPAWRSALWLLVVARLLLPITPSSPWSLFHLMDRIAAWQHSTPDTTTTLSAPLSGNESPFVWIEPLESQAWLPPLSMRHDRPQPPSIFSPPAWTDPSLEPAPSPTAEFTKRTAPWIPTFFWTWLLGVVLLGTRLGSGATAFYRSVRRLASVRDPRVLALLEECRAIMGTRIPITLIETDAVDSPALFGFLRMRLLLPTGVLRRLSNADLRHLFLHELAHVRRGDVPINWMISALLIVHWFNPVVWFAFARMRADRELACDAMALDRNGLLDRAAYGATVLKLVSGLRSARPAPGLVGISEGRSNLKCRIRMIAAHRPSPRWSVWAVLIFLTLGLISLTDARDAGDPQAQKVAPPSEVGTHELATGVSGPDDRSEAPTADGASSEPAQHRWPLFDDRLLGFPQGSEEADRFYAALDAHQAARHTRNGRHLYEMGRLLEAEAELRRALQLDPELRAAQYYLHLIAQARREAVRRKVRDIVLREVIFDGVPLPLVLEHLQEAIRHDPAGQDLRFRIQPTEDGLALAPPAYPAIGAATPSTSAKPIDLYKVMIHIVTPLRIVRLTDVLEAIVGSADQPIRYFIDETGVVFTQAPPGSPADSHEPETRLFRVNLGRFLENEEQVRELFSSAGVDLQLPHFLHLNTRTGVLIVRATPDELRVIQHLLETTGASVTPPLVALESRIVRMNLADAKRLGLEWFTGTLMLGMLHDPVRSATTPGQISGILTADQFNQIQRALEQDPSVRLTKSPTITNLSGYQTRLAHYLPDNTHLEVDFLPLVQRNGYGIDLGVRLRVAGADGDSSIHAKPSDQKSHTAPGYTIDAAIWDGQTILLGGSFPVAPEDPVMQELTEPDEIFFVLLTPTITDRAGNRVQPPDRLPFDPNTVPSQDIGR
jgi:beta-lactamase regulating signal transducer with metallopeptidase domain